MDSVVHPIALRKAKTVYNFGLSAIGLKEIICFRRSKLFSLRVYLIEKGGNSANNRVALPENEPILHEFCTVVTNYCM